MKREADLLVLNCRQLLTLADSSGKPRIGPALAEIGIIDNGALAARQGRVVTVGGRAAVESSIDLVSDGIVVDAGGRVVMQRR